jgi:F-type H+-transporting ATPase subunit delta
MGSATRGALARATTVLAQLGPAVNLQTGEQLFEAARVVEGSSQLRSALSDPSADAGAKSGLVQRIFASFDEPARRLLETIVSTRWSSSDEFVAGIEEVGIRAIIASTPDGISLERELHSFGIAVASDAELELALGSKLSPSQSKLELVERLLAGKAAQQTITILRQLIAHPRGRRIPEMLRFVSSVVADQGGFVLVEVTGAAPFSAAQLDRLRSALAAQHGRPVQITTTIDRSLIGGMRVRVADEVIDGSVAARLDDLRMQFAS